MVSFWGKVNGQGEAVERVVIPLRQPVDLLPHSARVRKMQHQPIARYRLHSKSVGKEK